MMMMMMLSSISSPLTHHTRSAQLSRRPFSGAGRNPALCQGAFTLYATLLNFQPVDSTVTSYTCNSQAGSPQYCRFVLRRIRTMCKRFIFLSILFLLHTRSSQLSDSHGVFTLYATGFASVQISNTWFVSRCFYTIGIYIVSTFHWRPQCCNTLAAVEALKGCPHYTQLVRVPRRVHTATSRDEFRRQVTHLLPRHVQREDGRMLSSQSSVLPRRTSERAQHPHELRPASIRRWP